MAHGIISILIGGKKRTVSFNNHSLIFMGQACKCDATLINKEIMKIAEINPLRALTFIIYGGLMGWLESQAIYEHDITLKLVSEWVGDSDVDEFNSVWSVFTDALKIPAATEKQIKEYEDKLKSGSIKKKNSQPKTSVH